MATRGNVSTSQSQEGDTSQLNRSQGQRNPFSYCTDAIKLNTQMLEQSLRIMGAPLSQSSAGKNMPLNGLALTLKFVEQYQNLMFAQLESMAELQSQLWQTTFDQMRNTKISQGAAREKATDKSTQ